MSRALESLARIAVDTGQPLDDLIRRHATDGLLRRLAATPDAGAMVLRGSLMTRLWVRPAYRPARDLDYVTTYPFDPDRTARAIRRACALEGAGDGVTFPPEGAPAEPTWAETPFPGTRFRLTAAIGGRAVTVQVDLGHDDPLVPPAEWVAYPPLLRGPGVRVLACRPELGFAWKVQGLFESPRWRAKDLHDVSLMARHTPLDRGLATAAIRVAFASRGTPLDVARRLLEGHFGTSRGSRANWRALRRQRLDPSIPPDLCAVVRSVADFLRPIFADLGIESG